MLPDTDDLAVSVRLRQTNRLPFSKRRLEALPSPPDGRIYWYDEKTPGLALCVTSAGSKTFYVYRKIDGRPIRYKLGSFSDLSVEQARKQTAKINAAIARGENPQAKRRAGRQEMSIGELFASWIDNHAKIHKRTWKEDQRLYKRHLERLKGRKLSQFRKADVGALHARVGKQSGYYEANRLLALIRAAFNYARNSLDWPGDNPTRGVKRYREESRDRFLQPEELTPLMEALDAETPLIRDFFKLCLFLGARQSNVREMKWQDIHGDTWRIPRTKNEEPLILLLVPEAIAILDARRELTNGSPWVFPSPKSDGPLTTPGAQTGWRRVRKKSGLENLRPHDLRRTLGSWQAGAGVSTAIIGKTLGHKSPQATAIYSRLHLDPVRAAMTAATSAIMKSANGRSTEGKGDGVV